MNLFSDAEAGSVNLLPKDGTVLYYGTVFSREESDRYLALLLQDIEWAHDEAIILGKRIVTKRKVAWYGDTALSYTYSGVTKTALPWTDELLALKATVEAKTGETFNSCLLNLYHDGSESMGWHSDGEKALKKNGAIASVSFGAARKFAFKHKVSKETISLVLEHGSLLLMAGTTQAHWLHRLPPTKATEKPRVNLTFRTIAL